MSNVLVIFQADTEHTEQLALAVAVGAVEALGNIRLRRLASPEAAEVAHKGYGKLQIADLAWADTIAIGLERDLPRTDELATLLDLLKALDPSTTTAKRAWTFGPNGYGNHSEARAAVAEALQAIGITTLPVASLITETTPDLLERMKQAGRISAHDPRLEGS